MKPTRGIVVDGYSLGNPGEGGYKGIDLETGKVMFQGKLKHCSNNIAEFLGVCHALGYIKEIWRKEGKVYNEVYTDSQTAIAWVEKKETNTSCTMDDETKNKVERSLRFLVQSGRLALVKKWNTKEWGESPADFGHK